ncbi:MAG: hypothetical protein U0841_25220 [Chloroflexia bacterium]
MTENFCAGCNRCGRPRRKLRLCLLRADELDLRLLLRNGASDVELRAAIREGVWRKPWGHGLKDGVLPVGRGCRRLADRLLRIADCGLRIRDEAALPDQSAIRNPQFEIRRGYAALRAR